MSLRRLLLPCLAFLLSLPAAAATSAPAAAPAPISLTATPGSPQGTERANAPLFRDGLPSGLFLMTRYWFASRTLEILAWYFAPDGSVYEGLATGFSAEDLARHQGRHGHCKLTGNTLEITWADGTTSSSDLERSDSGFNWDMGIFTRATPMPADRASLAGRYEGGASVSGSGGTVSTAQTLELDADGTYRWSGVGAVSARSEGSTLSGGSSSAANGRWQADEYSLVLTDRSGAVTRRIAFPYDDPDTPVYPDRLLFGGIMLKKTP